MKTVVRLVVVLIIFNYSGKAFAQKENRQVAQDTIVYKEKVYLHLDRSYYTAGDDIWFKTYLLNARTHRPESEESIVFVDLITGNGHVADSKIINSTDGFGFGDFELANNLSTGTYFIRAYTNYMRNFNDAYFFKKKIHIKGVDKKREELGALDEASISGTQDITVDKPSKRLDVQFFPEGGYLVNGVLCNVGIKVLQPNGKGVNIKANIVDEAGNQVVSFETQHLGMGAFYLKPELGKEYYAKVESHGDVYRYKLPKALASGSTLRVQEFIDSYRVVVMSSKEEKLNAYKVKVTNGSGLLYNGDIDNNKPDAVFKVQKSFLTSGIVKFTLYNEKGLPICERLVFNYDGLELGTLQVNTFKKDYKKNENIVVQIGGGSADMYNLEQANVSVSVTDVVALEPKFTQPSMPVYLLLNSELRGHIEQPDYYFYSKDEKSKKYMNLLMLTQGWRQLIYDDIPESKDVDEIFMKEQGITVSGTISRHYNKKKPAIADVSLITRSNGAMNFAKARTEADGKFLFREVPIMSGDTIVIKVKDKKLPELTFDIEIDSLLTAPVGDNFIIVEGPEGNNTEEELDEISEVARYDDIYSVGKDFTQLEEVELFGEKKIEQSRSADMKKVRKNSAIYNNASFSLDFEKIRGRHYLNLIDALKGRVPGVYIQGDEIYMRGPQSLTRQIEPLFLLNGIPSDKSIVTDVPFEDVDFIDVLKGPQAAVYGDQAGGGVIAVYTLQGGSRTKYVKKAKNETVVRHHGFCRSRNFYQPAYNTSVEPQSATLYWNPLVVFDADKGQLEFNSGSLSGAYSIRIEGITQNGVAVYGSSSFVVD